MLVLVTDLHIYKCQHICLPERISGDISIGYFSAFKKGQRSQGKWTKARPNSLLYDLAYCWPGQSRGCPLSLSLSLACVASPHSPAAGCASARSRPRPRSRLSQSGSAACTSERFPDKPCTEIPEITQYTDPVPRLKFYVILDNNL